MRKLLGKLALNETTICLNPVAKKPEIAEASKNLTVKQRGKSANHKKGATKKQADKYQISSNLRQMAYALAFRFRTLSVRLLKVRDIFAKNSNVFFGRPDSNTICGFFTEFSLSGKNIDFTNDFKR